MQSKPELNKHFLYAVMAAVLLEYFISPATQAFGHMITWLGDNVSTHFTNAIYRSAARGSGNGRFSRQALDATNIFVMGFYFVFAAYISILGFGGREKKSQSVDQAEITHRRRTARKIAVPGVWLMAGTMALTTFASLASNLIIFDTNISFSQRLTVLAAHSPDQRIKELRADWALMRTRQDYERINVSIEAEAQKVKIELPKPLWP